MAQLYAFNSGTDEKIDTLVYELYGLSEEVKIVEEVEKRP